MTNNEEAVLAYLRKNRRFISPTEIGKQVGGGNKRSSWGSPICLRLVKLGLVHRHECGWYKAR